MNVRAVLLVGLVVVPLAACSKKKPACPAGSYENADPAFCLPLPAGFKADAPQGGASGKSMRIAGAVTDGFASYTVYWGDDNKSSLEERAKIVDGMAGGSLTLLDKGDVTNGKWWRFRTEQNTIFATLLVKGAKGILRCEIQNTPEAVATQLLDSCKGLQAD